MKKTVYEGKNDGLFDYTNFLLFLESNAGEREIERGGEVFVFHLTSLGVTVKYNAPYHIKNYISINAFGEEKQIGKLEEMIRENS